MRPRLAKRTWWVRIKLDGSEPVVLASLVAAKVATVEPLAGALVMLFDAIAESLRWTR